MARDVILPAGHTATDRIMAERVAAELDLEELIVCHLAVYARRSGRHLPPPEGAHPVAAIVSEVALGLTYLWDAVRITARGR